MERRAKTHLSKSPCSGYSIHVTHQKLWLFVLSEPHCDWLEAHLRIAASFDMSRHIHVAI